MSEFEFMEAIAGAGDAQAITARTITQQWQATDLSAPDMIKLAATNQKVLALTGGQGESAYTGAQ